MTLTQVFSDDWYCIIKDYWIVGTKNNYYHELLMIFKDSLLFE